MIRKYTLIVIFGFIFFGTSSAQSKRGNKKDRFEVVGVYLKNGSVIIGNLTKETKSEIKLLVKGRSSLSLPNETIKRIKRTSEGYSFTSKGKYNYDKGIYCALYPLVIYYGRGWTGDSPLATGIGSQFMIGRHHNARLSYGLMVGILQTDSYDEVTDYPYWFKSVPVAALVNYNINLRGPRLYMTSKVGYAFMQHRSKWDEDIELGAYGTIGLGIAMPTRYLPRFTIEVEGAFIKTSGLTGSSSFIGGEWYYESFSRTAQYLSVKFGIALRQ